MPRGRTAPTPEQACKARVRRCRACGRNVPKGRGTTPAMECRQCGGTDIDPDTQCQQWPAPGTTKCYSHGGSAPQTKAAGRRRVAEAQAQAELRRLLPAVAPITNPLEVFPVLAARVVAWSDLIESKLAAIPGDAWTSDSIALGQQLHPLVALFQPALAECRQTLAAFARLNIDERLAKIEEAKLEAFGTWLASVLEAAELPDESTVKILDVVEARWSELER